MAITRFTVFDPTNDAHKNIVHNLREGYKGKLLSSPEIGDRFANAPIEGLQDDVIWGAYIEFHVHDTIYVTSGGEEYQGDEAIWYYLHGIIVNLRDKCG